MNQDRKINLFSAEHGYYDYDVSGYGNIKRACVPFKLDEGDTFNVYIDGGTKVGCEWFGDLHLSLIKMMNN